MSKRRISQPTGVAAAAVSASVLALLVGCGSSSSGSVTPAPTPTPTTAAPTTAAPTTTAPSTVPPTTAPPTVTPPTTPPSTTPVEPAQYCRLSELTLSAGQGGGAAGTIYGTILFRNSGSRTCELQGYPGVAGLNSSGQQIAQAVRVPGQGGGNGSQAVTLAPGATVSAAVSGTDVPVGGATACADFTSLLVTPPGETHSTVVTLKLPGCSGLKVYPVVAGTTGM